MAMTFEDMVRFDDHSIQRILKEVDGNVFAVALKIASPDLLARVYKNLSTRAATLLKEDVELGATIVPEVEEAQHQIVDLIRSLEASGAIRLRR